MMDIPFTKEFGYVRLARILTPGSKKVGQVLEHFGSIEAITALSVEQWEQSKLLSERELKRVAAIKNEEIYAIIKYCKVNDIRIITPEDDEYPEGFRLIESPPAVIYARGQRLQTGLPHIAVVGARRSTDFGNRAAYSLGARLALCGFTIVSGGAVGVDSMAHAGALAAGGRVVMVLGCGFDSGYLPLQNPLRNSATVNGTLITEFEPHTPAAKYTFPIRNRLISAISSGVAVIEAGQKSGALITATYAMEQGKEIFALPGNINQPQYGGTNELLRDGAVPLLSIEDIVQVYQGRFPNSISLYKGELSEKIKKGFLAERKRLYGDGDSFFNGEWERQAPPQKTTPQKQTKEKPAPKKAKDGQGQASSSAHTAQGDTLPTTPVEQIPASEAAKKVYLSFTKSTEFSDTLSAVSSLSGGEFITAVTELEMLGFIRAVPVGQYERIK